MKLTADGKVKILDFGLAKARETPTPQRNPSISPTLTLEGTRAGVILGTAAYMAPEPARGAIVDNRVDIWAFGVVLYEMLTQMLYTGETTAEIRASVLKDKAKLDELPSNARYIIEHCLRKEPRQRWQAIGDIRLAIDEPPRIEPAPTLSLRLRWAVSAVLLLGLAALALAYFHQQGVMNFSHDLALSGAPRGSLSGSGAP